MNIHIYDVPEHLLSIALRRGIYFAKVHPNCTGIGNLCGFPDDMIAYRTRGGRIVVRGNPDAETP